MEINIAWTYHISRLKKNDLSIYPSPKHIFDLLSKYVLVLYFISNITTKKTKISEGSLVRENVKSLSNSVTKFCDQGICEEFHFFRH